MLPFNQIPLVGIRETRNHDDPFLRTPELGKQQSRRPHQKEHHEVRKVPLLEKLNRSLLFKGEFHQPILRV